MPGKQKGVLYACIKLCFWRDKRFIRAGLDGMGYYAAVLAWLREDQTNDAVIPYDRVGDPAMVGHESGMNLCRRLCDPNVGLFRETAKGFHLLRYEDCNEFGKDIETRRKAVSERVSKHRSNKDVTRYSAVTDAPCNADVPVSVSVSVSDLSSPSRSVELISETEITDPPLATLAPPSVPILDEGVEKRAEQEPVMPKTPKESSSTTRGSRAPVSTGLAAPAFCRLWKLPEPTDPECASFLDYWGAVAGSRGVKLDWTATWRNRPTKRGPGATSGQGRFSRDIPRQPMPTGPDRPDWCDAMERAGAEHDAAEAARKAEGR